MALIVRQPPPSKPSRSPAAAPAGTKAMARRPAGTSSPSGAAAAGTPRRGRDPLKSLGLQDPRHALLCAPASYVDTRDAITDVNLAQMEAPGQLFRLTYAGRMRGFRNKAVVWEVPSSRYLTLADLPGGLAARGTDRTQIDMRDEMGNEVQLSMFTGPFEWRDLVPGQTVVVTGTLRQFGRFLTVSLEQRVPSTVINGIWTKYRGIPGKIAGERVETVVKTALADASAPRHCTALILGACGMREDDLLGAAATSAGRRFASLTQLLQALHAPTDVPQGLAALECARRLTAIAVQAAALRHHSRAAHPSAPLPVHESDLQRVVDLLPMPLTQGQQQIAATITGRLAEPVPLTALLSGDVGTGKTLSFLPPALVAHMAGARVAIISPMKLLADQIAQVILQRFGALNPLVERIEAGDRINDPQAILVGTAGLVSAAKKAGYVPQVLICDEQHKMSTSVREALVGPGTHLIEVSATPVPRSLAATLYEGMEILNLRECPVKKTIHSHLIDQQLRPHSVAAIRQALERGERAAVVYPRVTSGEEDAAAGVQSVTSAFETLSRAFPGKVAMLHGQMGDEEIRASIESFRSGDKRLVVASTVLEIGIDIPSVSVMVVRDADNFGIAQLHQLRGRLVRNGGEGHFFMYVDSLAELQERSPETIERLEAVQRTTDGYELAEIDLLQRGFGDIDGSAQTGDAQTLFRLVRLTAADFVGARLRSVQAQPSRRLGGAAPSASHMREAVAPSKREWAREDADAQRGHVQQRLL